MLVRSHDWFLRVSGAIALALGLGSCSRFLDALVTNPCEVPIRVRFWDGSSSPPDPADWVSATTVPGSSSSRVTDVFSQTGPHQATVEVTVGGQVTELRVEVTEEDPVEVALPQELCPETVPGG